MNKFKKIGFSALAGSLVAVSANAGEMSVAGSASVALEHINGGAASAGKSWSMGNQLTFSGSGELDNGMNVSLSFIIDKVMMKLIQLQVQLILHLTHTLCQSEWMA